MVGGVMIFSYIMGNFVEMINDFQIRSKEIGDGEDLAKFFGLFKKFNRGKSINKSLK